MNVGTKWQCEFCNRTLISEENLVKHVCAVKGRWLDRDNATSRLAYQCWSKFYNETQPTKTLSVAEFIRSTYYGAFWRFADYCRNTGVFAIADYQRWLLKNRHGVDRWCSDTLYTKFLLTYLPAENALDSVYRSVSTLGDLAAESNYSSRDYLRHAGRNRICQSIVSGKITAWLLYNCDSGIEFIASLDESQTDMIWQYIEPEPWIARFKRHEQDVDTVREILKTGGF